MISLGAILAFFGLKSRERKKTDTAPRVTAYYRADDPLRRIEVPPVQKRTEASPAVQRWTTPDSGQRYESAFRMAEDMYGIPRGLLSRVAWQESRYKPDAVSHAGAIGLMQIVPRWHPDVNPTDPYDSINYAARYLRQLHDRFGSWNKALAAYNYGPTALSRTITNLGTDWLRGVPTETRNYVTQISEDIPEVVA